VASDNPYQFTGRENDGTGLQYSRNRYYSPAYQRFVAEDPIGIAGGINLYAYVGNDPINFFDPFGTDKKNGGGGGGGAGGNPPGGNPPGGTPPGNQPPNDEPPKKPSKDPCTQTQEDYTRDSMESNMKWYTRFLGSGAIGGAVGGPGGAAGGAATQLLNDDSRSEQNQLYKTYSNQWGANGCSGSLPHWGN
jgi:RHS repeat-associated protein